MEDWRTYDGVAETYERVHAPRLAEPARDLVALAAPPRSGRVLDVGTGTGVAAWAALEATGSEGLVVGVDVSLGMLAVARRARPALRLAAAEAIDLPFPDATFDVVTASFAVSHFTRYETALFDMVRVLRPGGRLAVSTWGPSDDAYARAWREEVEAVVQGALLESALRDAVPWEERFADPAALHRALVDAGLRHVRAEVREYRFVYSLEEYLAARETSASGRFVRQMLGERGWQAFRQRVRRTFVERFADPLNDFRDVVLAVGAKPSRGPATPGA